MDNASLKELSYRIVAFRNLGYSNASRFIGQARGLKSCDSLNIFSEFDLGCWFLRRLPWFLRHRHDGFGLFIWKPEVILRELEKVRSGEFLLYLDIGSHINVNAEGRIQEYLAEMRLSETHIGVFSTGPGYVAQSYVKADAVVAYNPDFYSSFDPYLYAGIIIVRKSEKSLRLLKDWKRLVENVGFLNRRPSKKNVDPAFYIGNDVDNGLLGLVLLTHREDVTFFPHGEVNLYNESGFQLKHCLTLEDYEQVDWNQLADKPFVYRRDR